MTDAEKRIRTLEISNGQKDVRLDQLEEKVNKIFDLLDDIRNKVSQPLITTKAAAAFGTTFGAAVGAAIIAMGG